GAVSVGNVASGDVVTDTASVNTTTLSTGAHHVVASYTEMRGALGGADAANYSFAGFTSAANYSITQLALAGTAIAASTSTYASADRQGAVKVDNVASGDVVTATAKVDTTANSTGGHPNVGRFTQTANN